MYIYERKGWPNFSWDTTSLAPLLLQIHQLQGRLLGKMHALGFDIRTTSHLNVLTEDVVKTCKIEGEHYSATQVRSSIARRLGIKSAGAFVKDRHVEGIVEVLMDASARYHAPLTKERLFDWHAALFPTGRNGMHRIRVGAWRTKQSGDMEIVSGPYGRETVHYKAPGYTLISKEMSRFLKWCNASSNIDWVSKAALAHFWFVTIHPFDDGNGRIARAISDLMLARSEQNEQRFYSMSSCIEQERNSYYAILETAQKGSLDITAWMDWFFQRLQRAILTSDTLLGTVLGKADFWRAYSHHPLNERQRFVLNRLLDGFEGKLNSSKWAKLAKCSQDTALRDIQVLLGYRMLEQEPGGGRSTCYRLATGGTEEKS